MCSSWDAVRANSTRPKPRSATTSRPSRAMSPISAISTGSIKRSGPKKAALDIVVASAGYVERVLTQDATPDAFRQDLRHQCPRRVFHRAEGAALDAQGRFGGAGVLRSASEGLARTRHLCRDQGGGALLRANLGDGMEGSRHPRQHAFAGRRSTRRSSTASSRPRKRPTARGHSSRRSRRLAASAARKRWHRPLVPGLRRQQLQHRHRSGGRRRHHPGLQ